MRDMKSHKLPLKTKRKSKYEKSQPRACVLQSSLSPIQVFIKTDTVNDCRPFVWAIFRRVRKSFTEMEARDATKKPGFHKLRCLVDTGAQYSAITESVARTLKVRTRDCTGVRLGSNVLQNRDVVRVTVDVKTIAGDSIIVEMDCTVRQDRVAQSHSIPRVSRSPSSSPRLPRKPKQKHCVLGCDWISLVRPEFLYTSVWTKKKSCSGKKKRIGFS